ncbi:hypothetical protein [Comamonas thiooxydans]|uniref:hypothetical protein n=1 Tax=Comamonas thiooxydans TaxID=363952 RepID=UPI001185CE49|nr:hypothetical protein [Comamonas thiooxydans]
MNSPLKSLGARLLLSLIARDRARKCRRVQQCRDRLVTGNMLVDLHQKRSYKVIGHNQNSALLEAVATGDALIVTLPAAGATAWDGVGRWSLQ